ncbi:hypothetical protein DSECCO2_649460 [anaerobic digester metagenome]
MVAEVARQDGAGGPELLGQVLENSVIANEEAQRRCAKAQRGRGGAGGEIAHALHQDFQKGHVQAGGGVFAEGDKVLLVVVSGVAAVFVHQHGPVVQQKAPFYRRVDVARRAHQHRGAAGGGKGADGRAEFLVLLKVEGHGRFRPHDQVRVPGGDGVLAQGKVAVHRGTLEGGLPLLVLVDVALHQRHPERFPILGQAARQDVGAVPHQAEGNQRGTQCAGQGLGQGRRRNGPPHAGAAGAAFRGDGPHGPAHHGYQQAGQAIGAHQRSPLDGHRPRGKGG